MSFYDVFFTVGLSEVTFYGACLTMCLSEVSCYDVILTSASRKARFTIVVSELFTTAPSIFFEMCILRRIFEGHLSETTCFFDWGTLARPRASEPHYLPYIFE